MTFMDLIWKNALKKIKKLLPKKKLKKRDYGEREKVKVKVICWMMTQGRGRERGINKDSKRQGKWLTAIVLVR